MSKVHFAQQLKEARGRAGLMQRELAEQAGLSPNHVWRLEAGRAAPNLTTLFALGKVLEVSVLLDNKEVEVGE